MTAIVPVKDRASFSFPDAYLSEWRDYPVPMDDIGVVTFLRTYAATLPDGTMETWFDVTKRVVEGSWSIYLYHCQKHSARPDKEFVAKWSRRMFESMMRLEWCPAGRGLQHMGTDRMWIKGGALLNSCGFVSTAGDSSADWVGWLADMSMLGVGVGFDTKGSGLPLYSPPTDGAHEVEDTREGWADSFQYVVKCFLTNQELPKTLDFSKVRKAGARLVTMGGISSGPGPLMQALSEIVSVLGRGCYRTAIDNETVSIERLSDAGEGVLTPEMILDVGNNVGACVVSGGIRRSAEICLFPPADHETGFTAKQDKELLMRYRWASNNTNTVTSTMPLEFFERVLQSCETFGDPGLFFPNNSLGMRRAGEVGVGESSPDGTNPCGEQILESYELCNLAETVPGRGDHRVSATAAFLYGKLVSLLPVHNKRTQAIIDKNRRVGVSLTGWVEKAFSLTEPTREYLETFLDESYEAIQRLDKRLRLVGVPRSIKTTSVKPSGTVSLVLGTSPGMNAHFAPHYIRRINIENSSPLLDVLRAAGYPTEANIYSPTSQVVEFPCATSSRTDFSALAQLETLKLLQHKWSDNMVSNTIVFEEAEMADVAKWVFDNQHWLRSLSFLKRQHGFEQPPLETITAEQYEARVAALSPLTLTDLHNAHSVDAEDKWCDGGRCTFTPEASTTPAPE